MYHFTAHGRKETNDCVSKKTGEQENNKRKHSVFWHREKCNIPIPKLHEPESQTFLS